MASLVDVLRRKLEELGEVVKKADISSGWFAIYPTAWERRAQAAQSRGRSGPNLVVYRTRSREPRDHWVIPFSVAKNLLTDGTLTHSKVHGSVRWNLTLTDGQLHVSHRPGALDVSQYYGAPLLVEGKLAVRAGGPPNVEADDNAALGIVEGIERESKIISKSRSRRLRRLALKRAAGVCEACGTDFAALFGGMGLRALQVHHKHQLALRTVPTITGPDDLAVVCANCHAIIHSNPKAALPMEVLRGLWTVRNLNRIDGGIL
jgi:hypothetical protein